MSRHTTPVFSTEHRLLGCGPADSAGLLGFFLAVLCLLAGDALRAATISTTGGSFDLGSTATWAGGVIPGAGDTANFINAGTYTASNGSSFSFDGMTFNNNASIEISPTTGNAITINLGPGGISGTTSNISRLGSTNNLVTLALGANDQTWSVASGNTGANITGTARVELTSAAQTWLRGDNGGFTGTWKVNGSQLYVSEGDGKYGGVGVRMELLNGGALRMGGIGGAFTYGRGTVELVGDGSILVSQPGAAINTTVTTSQPISGSGDLSLRVVGSRTDAKSILNLAGAYTHTGDTLVQGAANSSQPFTVSLTSAGSMTFTIGANGVNNAILDASGAGFNDLTLDGTFLFDRSGPSIAEGNSWTIVGSGFDSLTYGPNFAVSGFTEQTPGLWTLTDAGTTWSFNESTGNLAIVAVPEPSALLLAFAGFGLLNWRSRRNRRRASVR